jgi:hypothetical protein
MSEKLSLKTDDRELKKNIYNDSYKLYNQTGNFNKALNYFIKYSVQKDSILNTENSKRIAELQIRFETNVNKTKLSGLPSNKKLTALK